MPEFKTVIDVPEETAIAVIDSLNQALANNILGQSVVKFAHWNVKGEGFFPAHKLFDKIYAQVVEGTDKIGERIVALGGVARGLPSQAINISTLPEYGADETEDVKTHMKALSETLGYLANELRGLASSAAELNDLVTQNRVLDIADIYDQFLYFLESHLR